MKCDVCRKNPSVGVASSSMGGVSFAYCAECLSEGREPWAALVGGLFGIESFDDLADWAKPIVVATCEFYGKTTEELFDEIRALEAEFMREE